MSKRLFNRFAAAVIASTVLALAPRFASGQAVYGKDAPLDRAGNFHSDALHVVERYTPTGPDHMNYEVTIEDPKVFTRPWKMSMPLYRRQEKNMSLLEYECYAYALEQSWPAPNSPK